MALRRINPRKKPLLSVPRRFSSNPPFPPPPPPPNDPNAPSSPAPNHGEAPNPQPASSIFQGLRDRLKSSQGSTPPVNHPHPFRQPQSPPGDTGNILAALQSFHNNQLAGGARARARAHAGAPPPSQGGSPPSLFDLTRNAGISPPGFDKIRESLRKIRPQEKTQRSPGLQLPFLQPSTNTIFEKELGEERAMQAEGVEGKNSRFELMNEYSYQALGKRLAKLRPAAATGKDGKEWFSLEELQGRIANLSELEKNESDPRFGGQYGTFQSCLMTLKAKNEEKSKEKENMKALACLVNIGGGALSELDLQRLPPQEELLERYFHPDHLSSDEKMKLELQRVRDEFKMSENDCGSARVQVAQLTVKIKHLSTVLHKKDKHSRKGLQDMVQRRKKYLKYLRRTDWDSYCLVLSKLGLRDVPEYKPPDYKIKSTTKAKSKKSKSKSKRKRKMKA